ncbi:NAD(P)H-hydrate dehydratase [Sphingomonas psychrotolerans]|uniref:ADP-dependent (S)-NAD(P)H-hydrate dehydratase n=1 Tax=Sphingomonas psychrotolerans TaxID=1327635 RepID=A0A2K8MEZ7_9SPHN|nr:NAD(P)H-hydrate dehydratase [Sphingomonas psychrotolerans]ATY32462.1 NAD(P)H-hydrate dehydratase [Sphingomonas psychrotolerans]
MTPLDTSWLAAHPLPEPGADTDKNSRGRVLVAGGSETVPGALRLTGEAALRAGAGKLQLATVERAAIALGVLVPEAAIFPLPANPAGELGDAAGQVLTGYLERCDALVLGPGTGAEAPAEAILKAVVARPCASRTMVLDAAIIAAAADMADEIRAHDGRIVLTPHPGEMIRLMRCDPSRIQTDPAGLAQEAARRFHAIVLLKGAETWIACPGEGLLRYPGGGPGLATGGSGDVLAGIIGGLLARGAAPRTAAAWGVWLHGEAGRRLAERIGPLGFLGRELLGEIPRLLAAAG